MERRYARVEGIIIAARYLRARVSLEKVVSARGNNGGERSAGGVNELGIFEGLSYRCVSSFGDSLGDCLNLFP